MQLFFLKKKTMKISASIVLALIGAANAVGELGFDLGVRRNSDGGCKTTLDYLKDFKEMRYLTSTVKVYAVSDCGALGNMGVALEQAGFTAFLGVWPTDEGHYAAEKAALWAYLPRLSVKSIRGITVGSETLYRKEMTAEQLADKIKEIKGMLRGMKDKDGKLWSSVPVGTVDSWNVIVDGASVPVIRAADLMMVNAFPYWQGQSKGNSTYSFFDDVMQALQTVQGIKGRNEFPFWVGETGWATGGGNFGEAVPSIENAEKYWHEAVCGIRSWGINTIVFEAYDEMWKPSTSGIEGVEKHWGVLNEDGSSKYNLEC